MSGWRPERREAARGVRRKGRGRAGAVFTAGTHAMTGSHSDLSDIRVFVCMCRYSRECVGLDDER